MKEYIKKFSNHSEYTAFTLTTSFIKPNVSLCVLENDVHYNPWSDPRLVITFDINAEDFDDSGLRLYFDDFPQNVCDDEYDGDMAAFKQNVINNIDNASPEYLNEYVYTGETYEYNGNTYYLWECTYEDRTNLKYLLTDRLNFDGLSLEDNINANHCPFIYILDEDKNIIYDNTDRPNYYLVAVRSTGFNIDILADDSNVDKIEIDGNILSDVVTSYTFNTPGKHIVKYTLSDPTAITESMFNELSYLQSVNIPNSVTSIGETAFYNCTGLTSITIPNSVTSIGGEAFSGCTGLTSVTIPNSVTSIGSAAFYGCNGLTSIKVENGNPTYDSRNNCNAIIETNTNTLIAGCKNTVILNSVTSIGHRAFSGYSSLTSVTIPNSVTSIGYNAFYGCSGLTSVDIPNSVTSIGGYAFSGCSNLTSVTISNFVTSINSGTFLNCSSLVSINIPNSVTTIGYRAFSGCSSLASITIPEFVTSIGNLAFNSCSNLTNVILDSNTIVSKTYTMSSTIEQIFGAQVTKYILGNNITTIGDYAFFGCNNMASVTIGNSVTSIGDNAFERCYGLTSITIPNSVTSISHYAFQSCRGLTSVTIGNSVTTIGQCAFHGCSNIASITCNATTAPTIYNQTFDVKRNGILYVPVGSTGYNVWMDTDSYYLGWHKWTKVEL